MPVWMWQSKAGVLTGQFCLTLLNVNYGGPLAGAACCTHLCFGWPCYIMKLSWAWVYRITRVLGLHWHLQYSTNIPRESLYFY